MIDLAIIPARGGSKRLPGKNLMPLAGVPLIGWTIAAARESGLFRRIIVSTDDRGIAGVARELGAETPFLRPALFANDSSTSDEMLSHALGEVGAQGSFALLQPTSPFRSAAHLAEAERLYRQNGAAMVQSVTAAKPVSWLQAMATDGALSPCQLAAPEGAQRVLPNGAIYLTDCATFAVGRCLPSAGRVGLMMGAIDSIDIDTEEDFALAAAVAGVGLRTIAA